MNLLTVDETSEGPKGRLGALAFFPSKEVVSVGTLFIQHSLLGFRDVVAVKQMEQYGGPGEMALVTIPIFRLMRVLR
jgi:hypothetical protein